MTEPSPERPGPIIDADSRRYWDFLREHHMHVPQCLRCGEAFLYPRALCPRCASTDLGWTAVSGHGRVYSYTVSRRASAPAFQGALPLVVALVELAEGPRLLTNLVDVDPADGHVGQQVALDYLDLQDATLPVFRPARHPDRATEGEPQ